MGRCLEGNALNACIRKEGMRVSDQKFHLKLTGKRQQVQRNYNEEIDEDKSID